LTQSFVGKKSKLSLMKVKNGSIFGGRKIKKKKKKTLTLSNELFEGII